MKKKERNLQIKESKRELKKKIYIYIYIYIAIFVASNDTSTPPERVM